MSVSHNLSANPPAPLVISVIKSPSIRVARGRSFGPSNQQPFAPDLTLGCDSAEGPVILEDAHELVGTEA